MPGRLHRLCRHAEADESVPSRITVMNRQRKGLPDCLPRSLEAVVWVAKNRDEESYVATGTVKFRSRDVPGLRHDRIVGLAFTHASRDRPEKDKWSNGRYAPDGVPSYRRKNAVFAGVS